MNFLRSTPRFAMGCAALVGVLWIALGTGCSTRTVQSADSVDLYEMRRYDRAYRLASQEHRGATGAMRERAALTAGLSAHAMGRDADAERWLTRLTTSRDPRVRGRADATLGLIALGDNEHDRAARLLSGAARDLDGEAAARAQYHAAEAYALAGRPETARLHLRLALAQSVDEELRTEARKRLGVFAYTVQMGAFSSRTNAERSAAGVQRSVDTLGLSPARIVEHRTPDGSRLYLVHVGQFASRAEATDVRVKLGRRGVVTSLDR